MFRKKRAGKKKGLTDPVEIIPFPGQTLRPAAVIPKAKPSQAQERPVAFKKEVKTLSAPTGHFHTSNISIKEMQERQVESGQAAAEDISNRPQKPFSLDELLMFWRQFAFNIKQEERDGADSMNLAMTKRDPKMPTPTHIHQEFDNQIQIDMMMNHFSSDLLEFLRNKLQNWAVTVEFSLIESQEENLKHMTGRDRFEILSRKNTNLLTLQKTFNLDIEY